MKLKGVSLLILKLLFCYFNLPHLFNQNMMKQGWELEKFWDTVIKATIKVNQIQKLKVLQMWKVHFGSDLLQNFVFILTIHIWIIDQKKKIVISLALDDWVLYTDYRICLCWEILCFSIYCIIHQVCILRHSVYASGKCIISKWNFSFKIASTSVYGSFLYAAEKFWEKIPKNGSINMQQR